MSLSWRFLAAPLPGNILVTEGWARPRSSRNDIHRGGDLRAAIGTPVYAMLGGTVIYAKTGSATAGNWVAIRHAGDLMTRYIHLSRIDVREGQSVSRGQQIGLSGDTGAEGKPHLHIDIELPQSKVGAYTSMFGTPKSGLINGDFGVKVPIEPIVPANQYKDIVVSEAREQGIPLYSGNTKWLIAGGIAFGAGLIAWKYIV